MSPQKLEPEFSGHKFNPNDAPRFFYFFHLQPQSLNLDKVALTRKLFMWAINYMAAQLSEASPLLVQDTVPREDDLQLPTSQAQPKIPYVVALFFLSMFSFFHLMAPKLRLLELTICRKRDPSAVIPQPGWPGYHIPEEKCKIVDVQQQLSTLRAWGTLLEAICSTHFTGNSG
jgi:hypothetical protein